MSDPINVIKYETCPDCGRAMHPSYLHIDYRDCQIALAAALQAYNDLAQSLSKRFGKAWDDAQPV